MSYAPARQDGEGLLKFKVQDGARESSRDFSIQSAGGGEPGYRGSTTTLPILAFRFAVGNASVRPKFTKKRWKICAAKRVQRTVMQSFRAE